MPTALLYSETIPSAAKVTWLQLRGLAWGRNETPALSIKTICDELHLKQSTLYGHMLLLKTSNCLSWQTVEKQTIIVSFPAFQDSGILETPLSIKAQPIKPSDSKPQIQVKTLNNTAIPDFQNSGKPENANPPAKTQDIQAAYIRLLGYKPTNWAAGEASAAKAIGQAWTVEQFTEAYQHFKAQPFWAGKKVNLRWLVDQIAEYFKAKAEGKLNGNHSTSDRPPSVGTNTNAVSAEGLAFAERLARRR